MAINDNEDDRKDLTRIEDLSEFLHQEDPELESKFSDFSSETSSHDSTHTNIETGVSVDDLDQLPALPEEMDSNEESESSFVVTEEFNPIETIEELPSDSTFNNPENSVNVENDAREDNNFEQDFVLPDADVDTEEKQDFYESSQIQSAEMDNSTEFIDQSVYENELDNQITTEDYRTIQPPEKFEEVKNFAQTFSYGQISVGGNPPYSVVLRNIKYEEDVDDIISILKELNVINEKNYNETKYALEIGSLLIPQISEYAAIVIAHKLRRFDCDIELGLSDEIHPPKNGDYNPRGLTKKESLKQNQVETYKRQDIRVPPQEIIVATTSQLEGFEIEKYLGVQSSIALIDEQEMERLKFVQQSTRAHSPLFNFDSEVADQISTQKAFSDYQQSFDLIFLDLIDQLKQKARLENANALLALNYQINQLPLKKSEQNQIGFQLICTATLAIVKRH